MMLSGVGNYFLLMGGWVDPLSAERAAVPLVVSVVLVFSDPTAGSYYEPRRR